MAGLVRNTVDLHSGLRLQTMWLTFEWAAGGSLFVAMRGKPRKVGTQLVLFIGPTGYHRSPAQTEFRRDKDSTGIWGGKTAGTLPNESIRGGHCADLNRFYLVSNLEGMK